MKILNKKINKNKYTFINEGWSNSNGWGHRSVLFKNNYQIAENKIRYINRTWEQYEFQSCMQGCVYPLIENRKSELKERFKEEKNITKLTQKYEKEFNKYLKQDSELKELEKLYHSLQWR